MLTFDLDVLWMNFAWSRMEVILWSLFLIISRVRLCGLTLIEMVWHWQLCTLGIIIIIIIIIIKNSTLGSKDPKG